MRAPTRMLLGRQKGLFEKAAEFEKTQYYPESELIAYQEEKLRRLIQHAYSTTPFYKELFDKEGLRPSDIKKIGDLKKLPVINKEDIRGSYAKMLSASSGERIFQRKTGGSTGVPLIIANNYRSGIAEQALYLRFLKWIGYEYGECSILLWGEHPGEPLIKRMKKRVVSRILNETYFNTYNLGDEMYYKMTSAIRKNPPRLLRGYASAIHALALKFLEGGTGIRLNSVTVTAEKFFSFQRRKVEEAFGENVFDQYGCGETNSIAFECTAHAGLHVASEHVIVELLDGQQADAAHGDIVITNLDNYAMPIIRYRNGDQAKWANLYCPCGRNLPLLEEIEGRIYDLIEGPDGRKIHAGFCDDVFLDLDLGRKYGLREFRIVQENLDRLRLEFAAGDNLSEKDVNAVKSKFCQFLGDVKIEIAYVDAIPLTGRGKKMFVLSLLNRRHLTGGPNGNAHLPR